MVSRRILMMMFVAFVAIASREAVAAEPIQLKVNKELWDGATADEKAVTEKIIKESNLIKGPFEIVGDPATPAGPEEPKADAVAAMDPCTAACKATRDVARGTCNAKHPLSKKARHRCYDAVEAAHGACVALCQ